MLAGRRHDQPGERLAARAEVAVVVGTGQNLIHRHRSSDSVVHLLQLRGIEKAPGDVRLVGDDKDREPPSGETADESGRTPTEAELAEPTG